MSTALTEVLKTGISTIAHSSELFASFNTIGSGVEAVTRGEVSRTVARATQSGALALTATWAVSSVAMAVAPVASKAFSELFPLVGICAALLPLALRITAHYVTDYRAKVEWIEGVYNVAIKVTNVVAGTMALSVGIYALKFSLLLIGLNAWSVISSAYLLRGIYTGGR